MNTPAQQQTPPGVENKLDPQADHGEHIYTGTGKLTGKVAVITGGDASGSLLNPPVRPMP